MMREREKGRVIMFPRRAGEEMPAKARLAPRQSSLGEGERRCTPSEVLQVMMQVEDARRSLETHAQELARLADKSARAERQTASRCRSNHVAAITKTLRAPMLHIVELSALLASRPLPAIEGEWARNLYVAGERLMAKLEDVVDLAQLEEGFLDLESNPFSLRALVEYCCRSVAPEAIENGIELCVSCDEHVPETLVGDEKRLGQIISTLLKHAVRHSAGDQIELCVQPVPSGPERPMLLLTVTDQQSGMTETQTEHLFSAASAVDGRDLGLALCKRLTEMMDGGIGVRSTPGLGIELWCTVQLQQTEVSDSAAGNDEAAALEEPVA